ncbi:MAG TPA: hypothetical protein VGM21_01405 [Actinomycetota bacterium]|jgi:hypothetical protein
MRTPRLDRDLLALDRGTAEWLLSGTLDPADAPPAYAAVAEALAAAAGPPRPEELRGGAEAVARFAAHHRAAGRARRRGGARRRLARLALVCAVVLGVLSAGGAGFATGLLPRTGQWLGQAVRSVVGPDPAVQAPPWTGPGSPASTRSADRGGPAAPATTPRGTHGRSRGGAPGPGAAMGLCKAWEAGRGAELDAASLRALAAAAGGGGNVPAYCRALPKGQGGGQPGGGQGGDQQGASPQLEAGDRRGSGPIDRTGQGAAGRQAQDAAGRNTPSPNR